MIISIFAALTTIMTLIFTSCFFCIFPDMINSMNLGTIILILLITFYNIFLFSYSHIMDYIEK
jgi:hypothetical protein